MAKFDAELPKELMDQLKDLQNGAMIEEMVEAGAKVVEEAIETNMTNAFADSEELKKCLKITRTYRTPTDDGVNKKIAFYGYFVNKQGKKVPAPLVAMAREYGTSKGEQPRPFMRKSFNKNKIERAMLKVQREYIADE